MKGCNVKDQVKWEVAGMATALKILTEAKSLNEGYCNLCKTISRRKNVPMPMQVPEETLQSLFRELGERILNTYSVTSCIVLHDQFGWGGKRLAQYMDYVRQACDALRSVDTFGESYCTFTDYAKEFGEKYKKDGLRFEMEIIEHVDELNDAGKDHRIEKEAMLTWLYEHGHVEAAVDFQQFMDGEDE